MTFHFSGAYEILVERNLSCETNSSRNLGTDAVDAMWRMPGVDAVQLLEESSSDEKLGHAKLSYLYTGQQRLEAIDTHLDKFGLQRVRASRAVKHASLNEEA